MPLAIQGWMSGAGHSERHSNEMRRSRSPLAAPRRARRAAAVACAVMVAWFVGFTGTSTAGWSGPIRLSARGDISDYAQVAFDRKGDAIAVWGELRGSSSDYVVMASRRPRGGSWTRPVRLSPLRADSNQPQLAVNPSGAAVVVWENTSTSSPRAPFVEAASRPAWSARWRSAARISPAGIEADYPAVGIDARGQATVIWTAVHGGEFRVQSAVKSITHGSWSSPVTLAAAPGWLLWPQIAVDRRGDAVAAWLCCAKGSGPQSGVHHTVLAASRPTRRHSWRSPVQLGSEYEPHGQGSASFEFPGPRVAISARGRAVVVWQHKDHRKVIAEAAFKPDASGWRSAEPISRQAALEPHIGMDARGDATALWQGPNGSVVTARRSASGRGWSTPQELAKGSPSVDPYPHIAVNGRGDAIATWSGNPVEAAVRRNAQGKWRQAMKLGFGGVSEPAIDPLGNGLVVWQRPVNHPLSTLIEAAAWG